ncbi:MAG: inner membrane-spanning protein YciB [Novosphingobium sp.]
MNSDPAKSASPKKSSWINLAIDFGPVLVFFVSYRLLRPESTPGSGGSAVGEVLAVTKSTLAFVLATVIALIVSRWKLGRVSPMLWLTTVLVIGFGLLTAISQDAFWIRHKPTAVYLLGATMLLGGWLRGKPTLRYLLESAFDGLSEEGWMKLTRNWGVFFLCLAGLNEVFANPAWFSFDAWLKAKLVVFLPLSFLFTFAHLPMLLRHGLAAEAEKEVITDPPHE